MGIWNQFKTGRISRDELLNRAKTDQSVRQELVTLKDSGEELTDAELDLIAAAGTLPGTEKDDFLSGGAGSDTMVGGAGDDLMDGGAGNDWMHGGDGDDAMAGGEGNDEMYGGAGDDTLSGGAGDDEMAGGAGDDTAHGGEGDDAYLWASNGTQGNDTFDGGEGNDVIQLFTGQGYSSIEEAWQDGKVTFTIYDENGNEVELSEENFNENGALVLGEGWTGIITSPEGENGEPGDTLTFQNVETIVLLGQSADGTTLQGSDGTDFMSGGTGRQHMYGGAGQDFMSGGAGQDYMSGGSGADYMDGGTGDDTMLGGTGADVMSGGDGWDKMAGGTGADYMYGGDGNDTMYGNEGADYMDGGDGADKMSGGEGNDTMFGGYGDDANDLALGGEGNDTYVWGVDGDGSDTFNGGEGNDTLSLDLGSLEGVNTLADALNGDPGISITYMDSEGNPVVVTVDMLNEDGTFSLPEGAQGGVVTGPGGEVMTFASVESINIYGPTGPAMG